MAEITASLVKELRERTGAGMMECKKALTESNGDIDAAAEALRKSGAAKADKKADGAAAGESGCNAAAPCCTAAHVLPSPVGRRCPKGG